MEEQEGEWKREVESGRDRIRAEESGEERESVNERGRERERERATVHCSTARAGNERGDW